jgi:hypothetical protein
MINKALVAAALVSFSLPVFAANTNSEIVVRENLKTHEVQFLGQNGQWIQAAKAQKKAEVDPGTTLTADAKVEKTWYDGAYGYPGYGYGYGGYDYGYGYGNPCGNCGYYPPAYPPSYAPCGTCGDVYAYSVPGWDYGYQYPGYYYGYNGGYLYGQGWGGGYGWARPYRHYNYGGWGYRHFRRW